MATPAASQILLAIGGRTLTQLGTVPWRKGLATRGGEIPYTLTRADATTCASYVDYDGVIRLAAANLLRIEWVDLDGDGIRETPGISLEGSRVNSCLWASDASNAAWLKTNATAAKNATGPDGVINSASTITATASGGYAGIPGAASGAASVQTLSGIVKAGTTGWAWVGDDRDAAFHRAWINLATGAVGTQVSCTAVTRVLASGWIWWMVRFTTTNAITPRANAAPVNGDNSTACAINDTVLVGNHQHELNAQFASSSILTTSATVTRAGDLFTVPCNFGPTDMTILVRFARPMWALGSAIGFPGLYTLGSGTRAIECYGDGTNLKSELRGSSIVTVSQAIPAGAELDIVSQYKDFPSGARTAQDVGSGYSAFSGFTSAVWAAFGNQTLTVGKSNSNSTELYGVLIDLIIARGLFTRAEMLAIPL